MCFLTSSLKVPYNNSLKVPKKLPYFLLELTLETGIFLYGLLGTLAIYLAHVSTFYALLCWIKTKNYSFSYFSAFSEEALARY